MYLGFHASSSGGVHNAIRDSVTAGARALALFLRPQRTWSAPPLKSDAIQQFVKISMMTNKVALCQLCETNTMPKYSDE